VSWKVQSTALKQLELTELYCELGCVLEAFEIVWP
jgi:hypothetical protein